VEPRVERMKGFGMDGSSNGLEIKKRKGALPLAESDDALLWYYGYRGTVQYTHDAG
jgi:hypothetical protein